MADELNPGPSDVALADVGGAWEGSHPSDFAATGDKASPAYYVAFSALVGVSGLLLMRERPR